MTPDAVESPETSASARFGGRVEIPLDLLRLRQTSCAHNFIDHSLRTTAAATRLFAAGMDEQLIMLRTGHRSATGVRSYKRTTSTLKKQTSSVLNDCTNVNVTNIDADESLPKKAKLDKEAGTIEDSKAISKAGHFSCSSSITLNFHEFNFTLSRNLYIL